MQVEFTDENRDDTYTPKKVPTMVKWLMQTKLVKNEKQANIVLFSIAVIFFVTTIIIMINPNKPQSKTTYLEDIPASTRANIPPELLKTIPHRNN